MLEISVDQIQVGDIVLLNGMEGVVGMSSLGFVEVYFYEHTGYKADTLAVLGARFFRQE